MVLAGLERLRAAHPHIAVINLSLGAYSFRDRRPLALGAALGAWPSSTVVVAAAGNAGVAARPYWPAAQGAVVGVAALLRNGGQVERAEFSNSGPWVDISTDGVDILSVYAFGKFPDGPQAATTIDGWARWSGTSFAAPIVAAEIARLVVEDGLPPRRALATLMERLPSATDVSPALVGCGRLYDPRATVGIDPTSP
jgi:subtilisin family serine protease